MNLGSRGTSTSTSSSTSASASTSSVHKIAIVLDAAGHTAWGQTSFTSVTGQAVVNAPYIDCEKNEALRIIQAIQPGDVFSVLTYDCGTSVWAGGPAAADAAAKASAESFVTAAQPGGGTNMVGALVAALADKSLTEVVLIASGSPDCPTGTITDAVNQVVTANTQGAVIDCFCVFTPPAPAGDLESLLRNLAASAGGRYFPTP